MYGKNKFTLSYSAIKKWCTDKEGYRDIYYRGNRSTPSKAMLFGSEIDARLSSRDNCGIETIPILKETQKRIDCEIEGVPFVAILDTYEDGRLVDWKTSNQKDILRTYKGQLKTYALCLLNTGLPFNGQAEIAQLRYRDTVRGLSNGQFELLGTCEQHLLPITIMDMNETKEWIILSANEIKNDYKLWKLD